MRHFAPQVSLNENLSTNPAGHRSKIAQAYQANFPASGLKGPVKRSAFGDLSNTSGTTGISAKGFPKYPVNTGKMVQYKDNDKENVIKANKAKDAFLRPAQRSITGLKPSATTTGFPSQAQADSRGGPFIKQSVAKKTTVVYSDGQQQKPQPISRQYRSQPYLKSASQTVANRTQSTTLIQEEGYGNVEDDINEASYEDAMEELSQDQVAYFRSEMPAPGSVVPSVTANVEPLQPIPATASAPWIFSAPLAPELDEYSDEDYDEDLYDEQGYTTAHSFKSYGDNTNGATTLLVPKLTAMTQQELEEAKAHVKKHRPVNDVEEEEWDVSMVAEYGEEIFEYMRELEVSN